MSVQNQKSRNFCYSVHKMGINSVSWNPHLQIKFFLQTNQNLNRSANNDTINNTIALGKPLEQHHWSKISCNNNSILHSRKFSKTKSAKLSAKNSKMKLKYHHAGWGVQIHWHGSLAQKLFDQNQNTRNSNTKRIRVWGREKFRSTRYIVRRFEFNRGAVVIFHFSNSRL